LITAGISLPHHPSSSPKQRQSDVNNKTQVIDDQCLGNSEFYLHINSFRVIERDPLFTAECILGSVFGELFDGPLGLAENQADLVNGKGEEVR
jgi:hypothetical protein